ncbi:hypothetical protein BDY19DRAFT_905621 [Irpex rosettiformis]|uniref:Uncharacterized protein n=1 Tax=Irpex rosettiformis TaxID=378272 RepID=A0ACB8U7H1_9APHY|nr:hypothetical protein BDY19DRAFT_905621 [Irpex rosettiformis]
MSAFPPTTPTRPPNQNFPDGHSSPGKRVHSRTSLHSPYSARLTRPSSRRQSADEPEGPFLSVDYSHPSPSRQTIETPQCSPQRHPLPRYQKRQISQSSEDPVISAIRSTYAEETKGLIPVLTGRLEQLSLDEHMVWEDLSMEDACQQDDDSITYSAFTDHGPRTPTRYMAPLPYTPTSPWSTPTSPAFPGGGHFSSAESSPGVLTPPRPLYLLASYSSRTTPSSVGPASFPFTSLLPTPPRPVEISYASTDMAEISTHDMTDDDGKLVDIQAQSHRELVNLMADTYSRSSKKYIRKMKRSKQIRRTPHHALTKPKAETLLPKQFVARRAAIMTRVPTEANTRTREFVEGSSTYRRSQEAPSSPAFDTYRTPTPAARRRRGRVTEDLIWNGLESEKQLAENSKPKRRSTNKPYSKIQRARGKRDDEAAAVLPGSGKRSQLWSALGLSSEVKEWKQRIPEQHILLTQTKPLPQTSLSQYSPRTPVRSQPRSTASRWDVDDGYQGADEASDPRPPTIARIPPSSHTTSTPQPTKSKEEEEVEEVERFLLSLELLAPPVHL